MPDKILKTNPDEYKIIPTKSGIKMVAVNTLALSEEGEDVALGFWFSGSEHWLFCDESEYFFCDLGFVEFNDSVVFCGG